LDCGPSTRPFGSVLPGVDCLFSNTTIQSFLNTSSFYEVTEQVTGLGKACYLTRCEDGSCRSDCNETTYFCRGNGCVQPDTRFKYFKCACKEGWSGLECEHQIAVTAVQQPEQLLSELVDPHTFAACGGPPPIRIKPAAQHLFFRRHLDVKELLSLNRAGLSRQSSLDVKNLNIQYDHAPYGIPLLVKRRLVDRFGRFVHVGSAHRTTSF
jgi:hypothetical protein